MTARLSILLACAVVCSGAEEFSYWIEPCTHPETACQAGDAQLADWAMEAWQAASQGRLKVAKLASPRHARIRIYWAGGRQGLYGETRARDADGKRGADVFILPDVSQLGPEIAFAAARDPLLRDAIVYLTCLHESGHAFGLAHTASYDDIMFSFGYGGDIPEYFGRYRRQLTRRDDIRRHAGMSAADREHLLQALAR